MNIQNTFIIMCPIYNLHIHLVALYENTFKTYIAYSAEVPRIPLSNWPSRGLYVTHNNKSHIAYLPKAGKLVVHFLKHVHEVN